MATTAEIPIPPALVNEAKLYFQCKIKELQTWQEISEETLCLHRETYISYTMRIKRPSSRKRKKKQITGTFAITMSGQLLPMQLIYQGTMDCCGMSRIPQTIGVTSQKQYNISWCFSHMLRKGKLSLSCLKIKYLCLYLMLLKAKSPIKILNLTKRIIV